MRRKACVCADEHGAVYGSVESLCCPPETNVTPYFNYIGIKIENQNPLETPVSDALG